MSTNVTKKSFSAIMGKNAEYIATTVSISSNGSKVSITAKWDTGAFMSCIPAKVVDLLSLKVLTTQKTRGTFGGDVDTNIYVVDLTITSGYTFKDLKVIGLSKDNPTDYAIIGMDIISQGDFLFSGYGDGVFSFQVPSTETISLKLS